MKLLLRISLKVQIKKNINNKTFNLPDLTIVLALPTYTVESLADTSELFCIILTIPLVCFLPLSVDIFLEICRQYRQGL